MYETLWLFAARISAEPNPGGLPGSSVLEKLVGGLAFWAILACVAGIIIGGGAWALGNHTGNYHHASKGKTGALCAAAGALVIGAAVPIIEFFQQAGGGVR